MPIASRIFLTGFMASGKTTLGPILAGELGFAFTDLDTRIEATSGLRIVEIFDRQGEAAFRALEKKVLRDTRAATDMVFALGGGALADEENLSFALRHGLVVYLCATEDTLAGRLEKEAAGRPLFNDETGQPMASSSVRRVIRKLMESRERYYRQAHVIFNVDRLSIDQAARGLIDAVSAYPGADRGRSIPSL